MDIHIYRTDAPIQPYRDFWFVEMVPCRDNPLLGVLYPEPRLS